MTTPVAVITGAASGIGLELAKRLTPTHRVAVLDRQPARAERVAAALGGSTLAVLCDITDQSLVTAAVGTVMEQFGRIDVAVSNAGIGVVGVARHLDPDVLALQLQVNVTGNWRFIHACLPHLIDSRGYLLGVTSGAAIIGPPSEGFYSASKAALEALLNVVRVEVAHLGVSVGIAYPMFIDTPMLREGDREHSDMAAMRARLPGPAGKTYPVSLAAALLEKGIRRKAKRIYVPSSLRVQFALRGLLGPAIDRIFGNIAPQVDALTAAKVAQLGPINAAFIARQAPGVTEPSPHQPGAKDLRE